MVNLYGMKQDWSPVVELLSLSLYGEQMVCSMSTQLFHIPATQNIEGNAKMHEHVVPASYHRVTATGSARRLQNGEYHDSILNTLITCIRNGLKEDKEVLRWLNVMRENAPNEYKSFVQNIIFWQQQTIQSLLSAQQVVKQMGYSFD